MKRIARSLSILAVFMLSAGLFSACSSDNIDSSNSGLNQSAATEDSIEEPMNTGSTEENELENYCKFQLLSLGYNEEYPPESLWFQAVVKDTEDEYHPTVRYVAVDLEGNYIGALDRDNNDVVSSFFDGVACVVDTQTGERMLIDTEMLDVTSKYLDMEGGEQVVALGADKTGITLWTRKTTDTYDSHSTELFAKDLSGKVKQTWSSQDELTEDIENVNLIEHINGSNYVYCYYDNYVMLNVETGTAVSVGEQHSGIHLDTMFDDGSFMTVFGNGSNHKKLTWYSPVGEPKKELLLYGDVASASYGEGLMYVRGEVNDVLYQGFVDENGNSVIDLDTKLHITNSPVYRDGYALTELENSGGETFVTLLDKEGNFAFEPMKGEIWNGLMAQAYYGELEGHQYYIKQGDEFYYLNSDGSIEKADYDFSKCFGFLGHTYVMSEDSLKIIK